jgi:uncharacterized protein YegL
MPGSIGAVLPVYFVADESGAMQGYVSILNEGLKDLQQAVIRDSIAASKIRLTIIGFSGKAVIHSEMVDLRTVEMMPSFTAGGSTSYAAAFIELLRSMKFDIASLINQGYEVHRPAVFFLSGGEPDAGDPWRAELARLKDPSFAERPNIMAFGIDKAVDSIIREVASKPDYAFKALPEAGDVANVITHFAKELTRSVVTTRLNVVAGGKPQMNMRVPDGWTIALDNDVVGSPS